MRFYPNELPVVGEVVNAHFDQRTTKDGDGTWAYVTLPECNTIQGVVHKDEIYTRPRANTVTRLPHILNLKVLSVNPEKRRIELSKKQVNRDEIIVAENRYNHAMYIYSRCCKVASLANVPLETLYQNIVWQLPDCYAVFHQIENTGLDDPVDAFDELNIGESTKKWLINVLRCWKPINMADYMYVM